MAWRNAWRALPLLAGRERERTRLEQLAAQWLDRVKLLPLSGTRLGTARRLRIALQAALPVLELGLRWYRGWDSVLIYPTVFRSRGEQTDAAGVVHAVDEWRAGESWERGPVILALPEVALSGQGRGYNVVIHECAHRLDLLGPDAEGLPPLHRGMSRRAWSEAFLRAYEDLGERVARRVRTALDPYAAESPGEFFAVASEAFFETPTRLRRAYPAVYAQLTEFYRQHPAQD